LQQAIGGDSRLHLLTDVTDMSDLMAWADVSISAGGSTCWELSLMGLPSLILIISENQRANVEALEMVGLGVNLGWHRDLSIDRLGSQLRQLMLNLNLRSRMSKQGPELVDGAGGRRVCGLCTNSSIGG